MPGPGPSQAEHLSKADLLFIIFIYSVNIKPPRHRFGLSLGMGLAFWVLFNRKKIANSCKTCPCYYIIASLVIANK